MDPVVDAVLAQHEWQEGKVIEVVQGSARHRVMVTCYSRGRNEAMFKNGPGKYGAYSELSRPNGDWLREGANVVPVLPDGRLLMVIEQRPPQGRYELAKDFIVEGKLHSFADYGPYSSLEFPGGAVEPNEEYSAAFLRELMEETEVAEGQTGVIYRCPRPIFATGADLALAAYRSVLYLSQGTYSNFVHNDGGLHVVALTREEVEQNIWRGSIVSGQAGIAQWELYKTVEEARQLPHRLEQMKQAGFLTVHDVVLKK